MDSKVSMDKQKTEKQKERFYINETEIRFERRRISEAYSFLLPTSFTVIPKEYEAVKYPSSYRPEIILTTPDLEVNLGFTIFTNSQLEDLRVIVEQTREVIENTEKSGAVLVSNTMPLESIEGYWFDFRTKTMDSEIYNMHLLAKIGKTVLQSSFNCQFRDFEEWKPFVLQMWESMQQESDKR